MKPDLIECWPIHVDFPLHRQFIRENRNRFGKVIVVFTNHMTEWDYKDFIKNAMLHDNISFMDNDFVAGDKDWRNIAVNKALRLSSSEWVWFTEEDFFPKEGFWEEVETCVKNKHDVFGVCEQGRLHPCCIFSKRSTIDKTNKNFGVVKDQSDHFGVFQQEIDQFATISNNYWYHMAGLSQNMWKLQIGENPNYKQKEFKEYCENCLELTIPMHDDFIKLFKWYLSE